MYIALDNLGCHLSGTTNHFFFLLDRVSYWPGTLQICQAGWATSPRDAPIPASPPLKLQVCTVAPDIFTGVLGIELRYSCFQSMVEPSPLSHQFHCLQHQFCFLSLSTIDAPARIMCCFFADIPCEIEENPRREKRVNKKERGMRGAL